MWEEVKKLSEGKLFKEICKIIYHLENASTGSAPSATAEGAEEEEVDTAEDVEEATPARCVPPGIANRQAGQTGLISKTFPWIYVPSAQRRGI